MEGSDRSAEEALARALLVRELNENALRELALAVRIGELERNRLAAFTLDELEWITCARGDDDDDPRGPGDRLAAEANSELERRARESLAREPEEDVR